MTNIPKMHKDESIQVFKNVVIKVIIFYKYNYSVLSSYSIKHV